MVILLAATKTTVNFNVVSEYVSRVFGLLVNNVETLADEENEDFLSQVMPVVTESVEGVSVMLIDAKPTRVLSETIILPEAVGGISILISWLAAMNDRKLVS